MNYYETLYIIHPALEAGRLKDIIIDVEDSLKKMGGKPLTVELWGKRKLSYYIDKQKFGTYVLLQYNGEGKCTGNFAIELEHNPNILAYLTTLIDQNDILELEEDLDTQIAGKTREAERTELSTVARPPDKKMVSNVTGENDSEEINQENQEDDEAKKVDLSSQESDNKDSPHTEKESNQENTDETTAVSEEE